MKVLVTGGSGRVGRFAIRDLLTHGHEAINADRARPAVDDAPSVRFVETDLGDIGQVAGVMVGCEAVIHLGAIPAPYSHPDEVVFGNNTGATFAVLQAAALLGVQRAAIASSVSAYGTAYAPVPFTPRYAPVDEAHPLLAHDAYALSKEVDERTAEMFHRRTGIRIAALRFHWVALPDELAGLRPNGLSEPAGLARLLWGYVDARDAGAACRLAIESDGFGCEAFNIVAADTLCTVPTEGLIRKYAPETEVRSSIAGTNGGFAIDKAERPLGWRPRHTWRQST